MSSKERWKRERGFEAEEEEEEEDEDDIEDDYSDTGDLTEEQHVEDPWKGGKKYTFHMRDLGQLMKINLKLSVKKVSKKSPKPNACDHVVWDALPRDGQEKGVVHKTRYTMGVKTYALHTVNTKETSAK
jgi:hypothetical protein